MQPLPLRLRTALKEAHPGLRDEDLDRLEVLRARSASLHPWRDAARLAELRAESARLLRERMPRFTEVIDREQERFLRESPRPPRKKPTIKGP
jgi:hypothetical protein